MYNFSEAITEKCTSEAVVFHVFIYYQQLIPFNATAVKPDKVRMLDCRNHSYLIHKFTVPLL